MDAHATNRRFAGRAPHSNGVLELLTRGAVSVAVALVLALPGTVLAVDAVGGTAASDAEMLASAQVPDMDMGAGILVAPDGRELWARDPDAQRAMASTTKIMTAVVVLENAQLDEVVTVSSHAASVGESAANLRVGDTITVGKLLEALLVKSGNDAAIALAEHVAGSEDAFVEMMNAKAAELGLSNTSYVNSHGLDEPGHHTSARDLAVLSRYAMSNQEFRRIVGLPSTTIESPRGSRALESSNELLDTLSGATGVKTGFTSDAGYCIASSARREGIELTAVVLDAESESARFEQASELLEWGFAHYALAELASEGETMGVVGVSDYLDVEVAAVVPQEVAEEVFDLDGELRRVVTLKPDVDAPVSAGDRIGTLSISQGDRLITQVPLVAASSVEEPGPFEALWISVQRAWRSIFGEPAQA